MKKLLLLTFSAITTNFALSQVTSGLIAKYSFNNGTSTDAIGSHNLTPQNGATYGVDRFGNSNHSSLLDGVNDYLKTNSPFFYPGQAYTFSLWFKSNDANKGSQTMFNTLPHQQITVGYNYYGDGTFDAGLSNGSSWNIGSTAPNGLDTFHVNSAIPTNWNHFVMTYNGSVWNYYMNNTLVNSTTGGTPSNTMSDLYFGAISVGPQSFFKGELDDIRIYNRAITVLEMDSLFNEADPAPHGLIAKYSFNNGNSNDEIGSNNLTPLNGATYGIDRFGNANHSSLLDGANDYLKTTSPFFKPGQAYTFSLWFKSGAANQASQTLFGTQPLQLTVGYNFYGDGTFDAGISSGNGWDIGSTSPVGLDTFHVNSVTVTNWNNLIMTYNGSVWKYYMNNTLVNSTNTGTPANNITDIFIGAVCVGPQSFFKGSIDDIRVYDYAISLTEIADLYNEVNPATVGINENLLNKNSIIIYPNPTNSTLTINVSMPTTISIINVLGQELLTQKVQSSETINVSNLENGIYFVKDLNAGKTIKFIKE